MMKTNKSTQIENKKLLMDIVELKIKLSELFTQSGPNTSEYISLSIKLDCLMNEYFNEKIEQLI
ncbi:Spo0E family sporulation regulatory protein-aspartic acid phosphatase [Neobacillus driksii]